MNDGGLTLLPDGVTVNVADEFIDENEDTQKLIDPIIHACPGNYGDSLEKLAWAAVFAGSIAFDAKKHSRSEDGKELEPEGKLLKALKSDGKAVDAVNVSAGGYQKPEELLNDANFKRIVLELLGYLLDSGASYRLWSASEPTAAHRTRDLYGTGSTTTACWTRR